jgi:hypothetical protein
VAVVDICCERFLDAVAEEAVADNCVDGLHSVCGLKSFDRLAEAKRRNLVVDAVVLGD